MPQIPQMPQMPPGGVGMPIPPQGGGLGTPPAPMMPQAGPMPAGTMPMESSEQVPEGAPEFGMSEEAMRADLERGFEKAHNKERQLNSMIAEHGNKIKEFKVGLLQDIFILMSSIGVDLEDLDSINQFLQQLQQEDPDLLLLFESAMAGLMPEEGDLQAPPVEGALPVGETPSFEEGIGPGFNIEDIPEEGSMTSESAFDEGEGLAKFDGLREQMQM